MREANKILKAVNSDPSRFQQLTLEEQWGFILDIVNTLNQVLDLLVLDPEATPEANMDFFIKQAMKLAYEKNGRTFNFSNSFDIEECEE
jgi:hypothetical protein